MEKDKIKKGERLDRWAADKYQICMYRIDHEYHSYREIKQGTIYTCDFGENIGYEQGRPLQGKIRPALVVSNNVHNKRSATVVVVPLSTKFKLIFKNDVQMPKMKSHYLLYKQNYPFLGDDSVVKTEKIREVDKVRLIAEMGNISDTDLHRILKKLEWLTKPI